MTRMSITRLDQLDPAARRQFLKECRLKPGEIWSDPLGRHRIGCGDATNLSFIKRLADGRTANLFVHDPPYNLVFGEKRNIGGFIDWCRLWVNNSIAITAPDSAFYVWLGADQNDHFQPLPQFMIMMAETGLKSRSFITMRNQRGYGTAKNWMCVRQELLYYTKGEPAFDVQYTDIPKILRGYYKEIDGQLTENGERSKSENIRASNVWVDIQQVFYRLEENVGGCYAQKPLKAIERVVAASSRKDDLVTDFFSHSGTTLLACEKLGRKCLTLDIDPIFAEISIRRLERFRQTGKTGWQMNVPISETEKTSRPSRPSSPQPLPVTT